MSEPATATQAVWSRRMGCVLLPALHFALLRLVPSVNGWRWNNHVAWVTVYCLVIALFLYTIGFCWRSIRRYKQIGWGIAGFVLLALPFILNVYFSLMGYALMIDGILHCCRFSDFSMIYNIGQ